jgi:hypothetical protein
VQNGKCRIARGETTGIYSYQALDESNPKSAPRRICMRDERTIQREHVLQKSFSTRGATKSDSGKACETNPLARYSARQDPADFAILNVILKKVTMQTYFIDAPLAIKTIHQTTGNREFVRR